MVDGGRRFSLRLEHAMTKKTKLLILFAAVGGAALGWYKSICGT